MSNHTYRVIEIVATSPDGVEVESIHGHLVDRAVGHVQMTMKVGLRSEDS